ncbi:hypothetical protein FB451DRAFT_1361432 [Mycena latifolia]|nr:hypothetical protein FB451DRAFT_1361432 [Mycena latifolia]
MQDNGHRLTATIPLGSLALIPNNPLRYTALGVTVCLGVIYALYLKHPSTLLRQLEEMIQGADALLRCAKSQCPWDQISLTEEALRLLQITQATSSIKSRILQMPKLTWKTYHQFSNDIAQLTNRVKKIHDTVQLLMETERQRKLAVEISEAQFILCTRCHRPGGTANGYLPYSV